MYKILNFGFSLITFNRGNQLSKNYACIYSISYSTRKKYFCDITEPYRYCPVFETFEKNDFFVYGLFYDEFKIVCYDYKS